MSYDVDDLSEAVRSVLARGQRTLDAAGLPFSGLAGDIAKELWDMGWRAHGRRSLGVFEYTLIRETDAGDVVLVPPRVEDLEGVFEFLHYNGGMKPDMSIRFRNAEPWEELPEFWWEDRFEDYQEKRKKIFEQE